MISLALFALCFEAGLRLVPQAIPLDVLREFEPALRSEIAARRKLRRRADTVPIPRSDGGPPDRLWRFVPGASWSQRSDEKGKVETARMDDNGFCNAPADAYTAPRFDVLAVGDSFTWCTSVNPEDAWPAQLARRSNLAVYNLGLPGRGLHEYVEMLRVFGVGKRPRVVVMNVYEGNDLRDAYFFHHRNADPSRSLGTAACPFAAEASCQRFERLRSGWLGRRSYALNLALGAVWSSAASREEEVVDFHYDVTFADGQVVSFNSRNADRDEVLFARLLADGRLGTELFEEPLEGYAAMAREHGFVPVLIYSPSAYTAYEALSEFEDPSIEADLRRCSQHLREYFARRARELGLHYLDLTLALQAAAAEEGADGKLYFWTNVHYAQRGHHTVAEAVERLLEGLGLVPTRSTEPSAN